METADRRKLRHTGWALLTVVFVGVATTGARGSFGLFIQPWEHEFGASRAAIDMVPAIGFIALGLGQPLAGKLAEKGAAKRVVLMGLLISALGFGIGAEAGNLVVVALAIGGVACFGTAFASQVTLSVIVARMFSAGHGRLFGLVSAAAAAGQIVVLPAAAVILGISLRAALLWLAVLMVIAFVVAWIALPRDPPPVPASEQTGPPPAPLRAILAEPRFWLIACPYLVCGITSTGLVDPHLIPYMVGHHLGDSTASAIAATLAAFNLVGVLTAGVLTDRVDPARLLAAIYFARALTLLALPALTTPRTLVPFAVFYGLADFASVPPTTELLRRTFRRGGWGLAFGVASAAHQAGSAIGAIAGGWLYDVTGGYTTFFLAAAVALLTASAVSLTVRGSRPLQPATA